MPRRSRDGSGGVSALSVSVVVPCYNYGHVLSDCVRSVLEQQDVEVRLLIIDDCSPDDTQAVGQRLAANDTRVEYRRHASNQGHIATFNEGLAWADGEFLVLLSADDQLVPGSLWRAASTMAAHPNVGMVYGRPLLAHAGKPHPRVSGRWRGTDLWSGSRWIRRRCRSGHNCISSPEVMVRTSVQRDVGGYDPACFHTSDLNMWLRIAAVADVAYIRGIPQAVYRVHPDSMLRSQEGPMEDLRQRRIAFDSFFAASASRLPGSERLRRLANRSLSRQALWIASRAFDRGLVDGPDAVPVEEIIAFAFDVNPDAARLREWHGLRLRRRIGAGRSLSFVPFVATGAAHRLHYHLSRARWHLRGV